MKVLGRSTDNKIIAEITTLEASMLEFQPDDLLARVIREKLFRAQPGYMWSVRPTLDYFNVLGDTYVIVCKSCDQCQGSWVRLSLETLEAIDDEGWQVLSGVLVRGVGSLQRATLVEEIMLTFINDPSGRVCLDRAVDGSGQEVYVYTSQLEADVRRVLP